MAIGNIQKTHSLSQLYLTIKFYQSPIWLVVLGAIKQEREKYPYDTHVDVRYIQRLYRLQGYHI